MFNHVTQLANRRVLEKLLQRKGHSLLQGLCASFDAAYGIAAYIKKVVINANTAES